VVEVVVYAQLEDLYSTEFLSELGESHPEALPAILGDLKQGFFLGIRPADR
jgi:hypothetical protein